MITVVRDAPVLSVGENIAVKPNTEVTFAITVSQKNGTITSFKFDLEGDGVWDNQDSLSGTYPASLKHTYSFATSKTFLARFYVRDSEGNEVEATRGIRVAQLCGFRTGLVCVAHADGGREVLEDCPNRAKGLSWEKLVGSGPACSPTRIKSRGTIGGMKSESGRMRFWKWWDRERFGKAANRGPDTSASPARR
jgi:hypothetical protein